jgi:hypothetical protein
MAAMPFSLGSSAVLRFSSICISRAGVTQAGTLLDFVTRIAGVVAA